MKQARCGISALFVDAGQIGTEIPHADGYILYDISEHKKNARTGGYPPEPLLFDTLDSENQTKLDSYPVIKIHSAKNSSLRATAREVLALQSLMNGKHALSIDTVAKREIKERYTIMADRLREMIQNEFSVIHKGTHPH